MREKFNKGSFSKKKNTPSCYKKKISFSLKKHFASNSWKLVVVEKQNIKRAAASNLCS